jgi:hypothetical protein
LIPLTVFGFVCWRTDRESLELLLKLSGSNLSIEHFEKEARFQTSKDEIGKKPKEENDNEERLSSGLRFDRQCTAILLDPF